MSNLLCTVAPRTKRERERESENGKFSWNTALLEAFSKDFHKYSALEHAFYENVMQSSNALFH